MILPIEILAFDLDVRHSIAGLALALFTSRFLFVGAHGGRFVPVGVSDRSKCFAGGKNDCMQMRSTFFATLKMPRFCAELGLSCASDAMPKLRKVVSCSELLCLASIHHGAQCEGSIALQIRLLCLLNIKSGVLHHQDGRVFHPSRISSLHRCTSTTTKIRQIRKAHKRQAACAPKSFPSWYERESISSLPRRGHTRANSPKVPGDTRRWSRF